MMTDNIERYYIDNIIKIEDVSTSETIVEVVSEYLKLLELLRDGLDLFKRIIKDESREYGDNFIKGFPTKAKLMIPILINEFNENRRYDLANKTSDLYVIVNSNVKLVALISMQVEKLVEEVAFVIKLILISTFNVSDSIERLEYLLDSLNSSIDNLKEIKSVPEAVLFEQKAKLN